jgi:hypothetical protein
LLAGGERKIVKYFSLQVLAAIPRVAMEAKLK